MTIRSLVICLALISSTASAGDVSDPARTIKFVEQFGEWKVIGGKDLGGCFAIGPKVNGTSLSIAVSPHQKTFQFVLKNAAWRSLPDAEHFELVAVFHDAAGKLTHSWNLDAESVSADSGGPVIRFDILFAANNTSNFVDQFAESTSLFFTKDDVPVGLFDLEDSSAVIKSLRRCRAEQWADDDFDPFAKP